MPNFSEGIPDELSQAYHGIACDACGNDIVGVRFQCMHCPCYNLCERCDATVEHQPDHVFALLTVGIALPRGGRVDAAMATRLGAI